MQGTGRRHSPTKVAPFVGRIGRALATCDQKTMPPKVAPFGGRIERASATFDQKGKRDAWVTPLFSGEAPRARTRGRVSGREYTCPSHRGTFWPGTGRCPAAAGGGRREKTTLFSRSHDRRDRARRCLQRSTASLREQVYGWTPWAYAEQGLRSVMSDRSSIKTGPQEAGLGRILRELGSKGYGMVFMPGFEALLSSPTALYAFTAKYHVPEVRPEIV